MITKNMNYFITLPINYNDYETDLSGSIAWNGKRPMKATDGTIYDDVPRPSDNAYNSGNKYLYYLGALSDSQTTLESKYYSDIVIGTGTTQATDDDYKLENQVILQYSGRNLNLIYDDNNKVIGIKCQKTYTNNTTETYQITEIGYLKELRISTTSSSAYKKFLLARETFSPIEVAPNQNIIASFIYMFE